MVRATQQSRFGPTELECWWGGTGAATKVLELSKLDASNTLIVLPTLAEVQRVWQNDEGRTIFISRAQAGVTPPQEIPVVATLEDLGMDDSYLYSKLKADESQLERVVSTAFMTVIRG